MTLADPVRPAPGPIRARPSRRRGRQLAVGVSLALLLWAGGATAFTYYYDSVPLVENHISYPVVPVAELPPAVGNATSRPGN